MRRLRFFSISLLSIVLVSCALTSSRDPEKADLYLRLGSSYLTKGDSPRAIKELLVAQDLDPNNKFVQNNLGLAYYMRQKLDKALFHIRRSIELDPDFSEGRNNLGRILVDVGQYDDAIKELTIVKNDLTYPDPDKVLGNLGLAFFKKGLYEKARKHLFESIKINRENCFAYTYYGRTLHELNKFSSARDAFERAIGLCKTVKFPDAHFYSGLNYYKMGQKSQALARFEELIELYPYSDQASEARSMIKIIR